MSLATRCTSCGTIFKVVQDQLKVSEGWVRCGRCNEVFNALDGLFDLERDPPPQRPASAPPRPSPTALPPAETPAASRAALDRSMAPTQPAALDAAVPPAPAAARASFKVPIAPPAAPSDLQDVPATNEDDALDSRWLLRSSKDGRSASERQPRRTRQSDFADAQFPKDVDFDDSDFMLDDDEPPAPPQPRPMPAIRGSSKNSSSSSGKTSSKSGKAKDGSKKPSSGKPRRDASASTPSFIRQANRQAQWRHPAVRATLASVALALLALLGLQAGVAFRDPLAAQYPETRPWLLELCSFAACEIAPWRHIEDVVVDSVTLARSGHAGTAQAQPDDDTDAAYKLSVVLHNRGNSAVAMPHIELSLTDSSGSLVSKRVLPPAEFGFTPKELPPGSNTTLQTRLASSGGRIAGYTVELFYP